jgi:hypothetical protein
MRIFNSPGALVTSVQRPIPREASISNTRLWRVGDTAVDIRGTLLDAHNRATAAQLEKLYVERTQQLIMRHSDWSLWASGLVMVPRHAERLFHIGTPATPWCTNFCHIGRRSEEMHAPAIWSRHWGHLSAYRRTADALLCSASPCSDAVSVNSSNE